ncbi:MAG: GPW/gp25 family protein [Leadbetterella sp.]
MKTTKDNSFLGTGWSFPPTFKCSTGGVEMLSGIEDVYSSLQIIISTEVGERVMQPTFGCGLRQFMFEPMGSPTPKIQTLDGKMGKGESTSLEAIIENVVKEALIYHEPRIIVHTVAVYTKPTEGFIEISVDFTVVTVNTRYNYVFPYYLNEATNLTL